VSNTAAAIRVFNTRPTEWISWITKSSHSWPEANTSRKTNNLSAISGVSDNPNFAIRLVAEWESSAITNANTNYVAAGATSSSYGTAGVIRFDLFHGLWPSNSGWEHAPNHLAARESDRAR